MGVMMAPVDGSGAWPAWIAQGARLPATALIDQFYAQVQERGGGRWDTSSLMRLLTKP